MMYGLYLRVDFLAGCPFGNAKGRMGFSDLVRIHFIAGDVSGRPSELSSRQARSPLVTNICIPFIVRKAVHGLLMGLMIRG